MSDIGTTTRPVDPSDLEDMRRLRILVITEDGLSSHVLPPAGEITIGRGDDCELRIDDASISRQHARLRLGPPLSIEDLGSKNGTSVRGTRVDAGTPVEFAPDDVIGAGTVTLIVQGRLDVGPPTRPQPDAMQRIDALVERIAPSSINVLLLGDTGVGKEVLARQIHALSRRKGGPFSGISCAALSPQLLESELFGHERGAFTTAVATKQGLLETAGGGTIFLDEIGDLPTSLQGKLLRVLEERVVLRVGSVKPRPIDVRFIAATNRDLQADMEAGTFRQDLFFRLAGVTIEIPPLRERKRQIAEMARTFVADACEREGLGAVPELTPEAIGWLEGHDWPGNLRELRNMMDRAVLLAEGGKIAVEQLMTEGTRGGGAKARPLEEYEDERERIIAALDQCGGNQTRAAKLLGIARRTLIKRLDAYGLPRPQKQVPTDDD
jgi:DNA-binding NtrC family response regulator